MLIADQKLSPDQERHLYIHLPAHALKLGLASMILLSTWGCSTGDMMDGTPTEVDRTTYPDVAFGTAEGDALENHSFAVPGASTLDFQALRVDEGKKLLLLSTGAGWCGACREEQDALQELQDAHAADGLTVLVTLFEDNNSQVADEEFVQGWIDQYDVSFDVVLDAPFVMDAYYDSALTPMNMFVDLDTMEIIRITVGFDRSVVDAIINSELG